MPDSLAAVIKGNLARVEDRIAEAATGACRNPSEIRLVGVTKYVDTPHAAALLAAGCTDLGESRPQQLWEKAASAELGGANWHLVGHLQRNKVRRTLPLVTLIHSVDSERLLAAIDREAAAIEKRVDVLLEINTSGDQAKHGLSPEAVPALLAAAPQYTWVSIRGLMTMAARVGGSKVARQNFEALGALRDRLVDNAPECVALDELSMGMSGDFEEAIAAGATIVRVGSLLWKG